MKQKKISFFFINLAIYYKPDVRKLPNCPSVSFLIAFLLTGMYTLTPDVGDIDIEKKTLLLDSNNSFSDNLFTYFF